MSEQKEREYVRGSEQTQVSRALLAWLNEYPDKPVSKIEFEFVPARGEGMTLSTVTAAYKTQSYISGRYQAQYQFAVVYRSQPTSSPQRLAAENVLNGLAAWIVQRTEEQKSFPVLGDGRSVLSIEQDVPAMLSARYADNSEDYQIIMTVLYEVAP